MPSSNSSCQMPVTALIRFNLAASIYEECGAMEMVEKCRQMAAEAAEKQ